MRAVVIQFVEGQADFPVSVTIRLAVWHAQPPKHPWALNLFIPTNKGLFLAIQICQIINANETINSWGLFLIKPIQERY